MTSLVLYSLAGFLGMFILFEFIPLLKKREWKQLIIPVIIMGLTLLYGVDLAWRLNILPNPNQTLYYLQPISERFESLLQINT